MKKFDLIVIGSGPAGEKAAVKAAYFGHKVALIEKEAKFGGAGVQTGTLPSKTLKETALYFSGLYSKGVYSIDHQFSRQTGVTDFLYRKDVVTDVVGTEVKENILNHMITLFKGEAQFMDDHVVKVSGHLEENIYGEKFLIATGSYPFRPENIPFDGKRVHDSDTILNLEKFPKSLCVLGAGVIGCEYSTIYGAMGVKVFLVNNSNKILPFLDHELSEALVEQMSKQNIEILFDTSVEKFTVPKDESEPLKIKLKSGETLNVDMFLFAAGRSGNIKNLKPENAGVKTGKRETILVNEKYQTNIPHIFAVGDVIGFPALASTSMDQGRIAVAHMFKTGDLEELTTVFPYGIYTVPEVSMVGKSEQECEKEEIEYVVGYSYYRDTARGKIAGSGDDGFMKILFEKNTKVILGVHIIGRIATEIIHYGLSIVKDQKTVDQVISTVFNYPTLHDLYKYACYDGLSNLAGKKLKKSSN
ncbi:MAG: NAD(P)(+) transhydrogenase [Melioribacteraceae bacterium]|nr:MAG: NAD(P)(+) transhydrogenase [Melioribacteraceae bacterium]